MFLIYRNRSDAEAAAAKMTAEDGILRYVVIPVTTGWAIQVLDEDGLVLGTI